MDEKERVLSDIALEDQDDVSRFAESYASFNRIINSLQRKYLELQQDFSAQNEALVQANRKLVDLSERNLAATEFLNNILNAIPVGVVAVDENGVVTHFNPAASRILNMPLTEPLGQRYRDVFPPGEPVDANALRAVESGREVASVEKKVTVGDGVPVNLSVSTSTLTDDDGHPRGAVEVFHDLTKMKKMEQELARLKTLAALGQMAATVAHEVRNPLSGIAGFAALLERELEDDDTRQALARKIIRGVESLNETVTTLLNYSRTEETNKTETSYGRFLKDTIEQFYYDNVERVRPGQVVLNLPEDKGQRDVSLMLDPLLFRQVFFNMFLNSVEATRGEVTIKVGFRILSRTQAAEQHGDRLLLGQDETVVETEICDDGPGIDSEHMDQIFSPFHTTKPDGNGLGLAVAWKIVKAHGGEIIAENRKGTGACFRLLTPVRVDTTVNMERLR